MTEITGKPVTRSFPDIVPYVRYCLSQIYWPVMLIPPIVAVLIGIAYVTGLEMWLKGTVETAAIVVLGIAGVVAVVQTFRLKEAFAGWMIALILSLLCREIHFAGTSTGIYFALVFLALFVWLKYPWFSDYLAYRWNLTLLATAMFSYFLAVSLDQHWWNIKVILEMSTTVEECVEVLGHCFILLLAIFMKKGNGVLLYPQNQVAKQPTTGARQG